MPGGARPIAVDDPEVVKAADFAMGEAFSAKNDQKADHFKVVSATAQVVNGKRIEIVVEVHRPDGDCVVRQFGVWNRAGPPGQFLVENTPLDSECTTK